jgi:hypothetical protein
MRMMISLEIKEILFVQELSIKENHPKKKKILYLLQIQFKKEEAPIRKF